MSKNEIDYKQCADYLSKRDSNLEQLVKKHGIVKLPPKEDPFTKFIKIIVNQQLSNKAASTIFSRLESKISKFNPTYIKELDDEVFREAGISKQKASYIKNVSKIFLSNNDIEKYLERLDDFELEKYLTSIKGLGQWSSSMYMMFNMHRLNIFTSGDVALNKAIRQIYDVDVKKQSNLSKLKKLETLWSPYRTIACLYLWKYVDSDESFL
ncbi:MAG: hypothetical protein CL746_06435 [Chloroflexi bacterium]|nr:hypothetical protein [Chloroflexota bacterium]|tara:strand:- start:635 stop:1264 length:630 start_codon:yes stop_codon:yes gene_type:complete